MKHMHRGGWCWCPTPPDCPHPGIFRGETCPRCGQIAGAQITEVALLAGYTERIYSDARSDGPPKPVDPAESFPTTWTKALPVLIHMMNAGQSRLARQFAEAELYRMAEVADKVLVQTQEAPDA